MRRKVGSERNPQGRKQHGGLRAQPLTGTRGKATCLQYRLRPLHMEGQEFLLGSAYVALHEPVEFAINGLESCADVQESIVLSTRLLVQPDGVSNGTIRVTTMRSVHGTGLRIWSPMKTNPPAFLYLPSGPRLAHGL